MLRNWQGIIIHHSETIDDGKRNDWEGIRAFHRSYRLDGNVITEKEYFDLYRSGNKRVLAPWHNIGYHFGIERVNDVLIVQTGRPLFEQGAHCIGKNQTNLGLCFVGNFDEKEPDGDMYFQGALLCFHLMEQFKSITLDSIEPHNKYANKTCPGNKFSMSTLKSMIEERV
jgi:hypothetical protein